MKIRENDFFIWFFSSLVSVVLGSVNVFGLDLTREQVVQYALANSEMVRIQEMVEKESALGIIAARSSSLPRIDFSANYDRNWRLPSFVFNGTSVTMGSENDMRTAVGLRQAIFSGGRNGASKNIAEYSYLGSKSKGKAIRQTVVVQAELAFYDVLAAIELASVSYLALKNARESLNLIKATRAVGRGSTFEELRARGQVSSMEADSIVAVNNILLTRLNLKSIIGLDSETEINIKGDLFRSSVWQNIAVDSLVTVALKMRPDLRAMRQNLRTHEQIIRLEKSARWPVLDFVMAGQAQMQSDRLVDKNAKWRKNWSTGLTLRIPVFDGFLTRSRIGQARMKSEAIFYEISILRRKIKLEVETSLRRIDEAVARVKSGKQVLIEAEKANEMAHSRYSTGVGTQLEILDAQLFLVRTKTNLALARRDRAIGLLELDRSLGLL